MHAPYDPAFLDAIETLGSADWEREVWRATIGDAPVLRANLLGARWNPKGVEALYCSLNPTVAQAEVEHLIKRQPVPISKPLNTHRLRVKLSRVVDLSSDHALRSLGIQYDAIASDDTLTPQLIGGATAWLGFAGLLVPSVRAKGTNLVIYVNALGATDVLESAP